MKTVIIIGSTGTIGKGLVSYFKDENCIEASRSIRNDENKIHLDLSDFVSILEFIEKTRNLVVDMLFLNSGVYQKELSFKDGYEYNLMVNAFGPYYIAKQFCRLHPECKIILTSSICIYHARCDLQPKKRKHIYRNTKLLEHMLLNSLEELYPDQEFAYAHPGILPSKLSLSLHSSWIRRWILLFGNKEENAIACLIEASKEKMPKGTWICPSSLFSLRGKPRLKKIRKNLKIADKTKQYIEKIEKELEEKYGISCVRL